MGARESVLVCRRKVRVETTLHHSAGAVAHSADVWYHEIAELPAAIRAGCAALAEGLADADARVVVSAITRTAGGGGVDLAARPDLWWPTFRSLLVAPQTLYVRAVLR